jgi:hypothetical protein
MLSSRRLNMKKVFVFLFSLVAVGQVYAAGVGGCTNGTPALIAGQNTATTFVRVDILPKCSANVNLAYDQSGTGFAVGANSSKGKFNFFGNTGGGAVAPNGVCTTQGACDLSKLTAGLAAALAAAT